MPESKLTTIPLFQDLPQGSLDRLERFLRRRHFDEGDTIVKEGDEDVGFYLIESGRVSVTRAGTSLATLGPGDFFGEMALLDAHRRSATVTASAPSDCLVLLRSDFVAEVEENPSLALELLAILSRRLRDTDERLAGV